MHSNNFTLCNGDCLIEMDKIDDVSIDLILTDPPYGTTACNWDSIIDFELMWKQLNRVIKPNGAIVLFGGEPFSSTLRISNIKNYKYDWIWDKVVPTGAMSANNRPMQLHEYISVFCEGYPTYNRQFTDRLQKNIRKNAIKNKENQKNNLGYDHLNIGGVNLKYSKNYNPSKINPKTIIKYNKQPERKKNVHPTQKPVELMKYLIKTYTNEEETVLDFTMGSGTTGVGCIETNRKFIGIEMDETYFNIAKERIENAKKEIDKPKLNDLF